MRIMAIQAIVADNPGHLTGLPDLVTANLRPVESDLGLREQA